jgi:PEP-CTERM motif-containing protein
MRKLAYTLLGAAAFASASIANAAAMVTGATNLTDPNPTLPSSIAAIDGTTTIEFGLNPTGNAFNSSFTFVNDVAGLYNFLVGTSTDGLLFTDVSVVGGGTTTTFAPPPASVIQRFGIQLLAGTPYTVNIAGTSSAAAGAFSGNVTIHNAAVPEPATWGMMILGFGAMGAVLRRRRRPVLAQLA